MNYGLLVFLVFAIVILTACAQAPQSQQQTAPQEPPPMPPGREVRQPSQATTPTEPLIKEFTIEMKQFSFTPHTITVQKGDTVRLTLTSKDVSHGFAIDEFGINSGPVAKNQQKTVEFIANKAGTFTFRCSVVCGSGHSSMKGTLIVEA